ncbi:recombinase family protein [uncultured Duncaniella sp.]|uniref:recombinase family protein n=1 Tax=uncultured Duncaniella sp. TaxID=2768039 RepID=UPI002611ABB2|nr:recombinase family protein [uncultured Duncaniella sp.]
MTKVVIFCRVSTKVQDYQRQVNDLTELASLKGWTVEKSFCETVSGATANLNRKELVAMLDYIAQHDIEKVMVTELSRLGRDTLQVLEVINLFNEAGVSLYIQNYNIETLTPEGKINAMSHFLITILAEVAKMERQTIRERMESGYENFISSGGRVGRRPGYKKSDDMLLVEYAEELRLLKKGISLRNVSKLTGTSVNTLRKCKALLN